MQRGGADTQQTYRGERQWILRKNSTPIFSSARIHIPVTVTFTQRQFFTKIITFQTVTVTIRPGSDIYRRGSDAPVLSVQIWSIGVFDAERNPTYSKALYHYLQTTTKLPADRFVKY